MAESIILLTGCIDPKRMSFTKLTDVNIRKNQYCKAIKFYLKNTSSRIVFIENSNSDVDDFEFPPDRVEIMSFNGNDYDIALGKGFGEMKIIEYGLKRSRFIEESTFIFKITGRHIVKNINDIFSQHKSDEIAEVLIDFRNNLKYCDSKIFACSKDFLKFLVSFKDQINDTNGQTFEIILKNAVLQYAIAQKEIRLFRIAARFLGTSGTNNIKIDDSFLVWLKKDFIQKIKYKSFKN